MLRLFYGCSYMFTCPAMTVGTVLLRALVLSQTVQKLLEGGTTTWVDMKNKVAPWVEPASV